MGKIAFVFAGQGAQYPGMGKSICEASPAAKAVLDAAEALRPGTRRQCFEGTAEELTLTANTQPCLTAVDAACAAALIEGGVKPMGLAGFSLGEVAALPFGGLLSFDAAFRLVMKRGALMQSCAARHDSGMYAVVKLDDEATEALCRAHRAYPVNYNCPGQVVCAMRKEDMAPFAQAVKEAGGRALPLRVSGGFHSPFMREAAQELAAVTANIPFGEPALPLYANKSCRPYTADTAAALLSTQVESPVRWTALIRAMQADGFTQFIEVGAGSTLSGLISRIGGAERVAHVEDEETLFAVLGQFKEETQC